ncbi:MAG: DNA photolyase family protein [Rhodospirillales bacterium]|nr:DNA photolyase family protein [Rhodospirillales bacterium]
MSIDRPVIVWFRQDLRTADQPALAAAAATGQPVLAVFVLDDATPGHWRLGGASRWWLHGSLASLAADLADRGGHLTLRRGASVDSVLAIVRQTNASAVYWNRHIEPHWRTAEAELQKRLTTLGVAGHACDGQLLFAFGAIRGRSGEVPRVFTPFWRACLAAPPPAMPLPPPPSLRAPLTIPPGDSLAAWRLRPTHPDWATGLAATWQPGETAAQQRLASFLDHGVARYRDQRNDPGINGTSRLSPYLHWGEVSARQIWHATHLRCAGEPGFAAGAEAFLREIGWREFCAAMLLARPEMPDDPLQPRFAGFPWRDDPSLIDAWSAGQTGYPIVDAGMRELWQTGWMHNRVRMIVASFLTKHLLQPWQAGERWFWDTLVDANLASNAGGWQWVAGCGVDAAPYFRIFNPVMQGEKFDAQGRYVRRWLPQLAGIEPRFVHKPWLAPPLSLAAAKVRIGIDYPAPIVDHGTARDRALAAFSTLKS